MNRSVLRPSALARCFACPGSVRRSQGLPDTGSSPAAEEGTVAHRLLELALTKKRDPSKFIGKASDALNGYYYTAEMAEAVSYAVRYVKAHTHNYHCEENTRIAALDDEEDEGTGTVDVWWVEVSKGKRVLVIFDYKHGRGKKVVVERNPQTLAYALGVLDSLPRLGKVTHVRMVICQPRYWDDAKIKEAEIPVEELEEYRDKVDSLRLLMDSPNAPINPNPKEQCFFCRAAGICKEYADAVLAPLGLTYLDIQLGWTMPGTFTNAELAHLLPHMGDVTRWAKAVQDMAKNKAYKGETIPGYMLVPGTNKRKLADEDTLRAVLITEHGLKVRDVFTLKPKTIGDLSATIRAAKKVTKKEADEILNDVTTTYQTSSSLVPETSSRKPLSAADEFADDIKE